jgi:hypothetical protein
MLKNILNLNGVQLLNKNEQKSIHGGTDNDCNPPIPSTEYGKCKVGNCWRIYLCTDKCPNGTDPICYIQP